MADVSPTVLRFALIGPTVGTLAFTVARGFFEGNIPTGDVSAVTLWVINIAAGGVLFGVLGLFLGFPLGLIPGVIAGVAYRYFVRMRQGENVGPVLRVAVGSLIGAGIAGLFGGVFFSYGSDGRWHTDVFVSWLIAGAVGAAVCALSVGDKTYALERK